MQRRALGTSDLAVSEFALGAMTFGMEQWGCDEPTSRRLIDRYLDVGGNFIDVADMYGSAEEICGRALAGRRDQVVIATKFGFPVGPGPDDRGAGRRHVLAACEASLRALQTDYIDLYQLHVDDEATPLDETLGALDELVRAGKVRHIGASNMRAYRLMAALADSDRLGTARFVSFQGQYNLVVRSLEREHFPLFTEHGLGFVSWSPLAAGVLTGKVTRESLPADTRLGQRTTVFETMYVNDHGFDVAAHVVRLAGEVGCSPAQLAIAWQRTRPVTSVILGARTMQQLDDNLGALTLEVPDDVVAELEQVSALAAEYPWTFVDICQSILAGGSLGRPRS